MTEIAPDNIPRLPRGVKVRRDETRGGWVLLAPERAVKLDDIGAAILGAVNGERSVAAIADKLSADFGAPREEVGRDVAEFLTELMNRRMVETGP